MKAKAKQAAEAEAEAEEERLQEERRNRVGSRVQVAQRESTPPVQPPR